MKNKPKVLFVCMHNSARSQIAEELLRKMADNRFDVESAGFEPGSLNPYVVQVLKEDHGVDIAGKTTNALSDLVNSGCSYEYVIAVCSAEAAENCPNFPSLKQKLHWPFDDPSQFVGTDSEKLAGVRQVMDQIQSRLEEWLQTV